MMGQKMAKQIPIRDTLDEFAHANPTTADQLLPLLHCVRSVYGCIPASALDEIAQFLNISRADVFGVVSFYDDFETETGGIQVAICGGEACQALGCRRLLAQATENPVTKALVKEVFCLGNCASGPSVRIGDRVFGRATLSVIVDALERSA